MARELGFQHPQPSGLQFGLAAGASLLLCVFALLMCASHTRKWRRQWRTCLEYEEPVIELNPEATMITTGGVSETEAQLTGGENPDDSEDSHASVWKKKILMGGKCQLPDFSGVIIYDSEGNVVTSTKTKTPVLCSPGSELKC